jgi:hypothetical protein
MLSEKRSQSEELHERGGLTRRVLIGALCWLLCLEWFIGQAIAQAAWTTPTACSKTTSATWEPFTVSRSPSP